MTYTILTLALLGCFGILVHNLKNLNAINRRNDGHINFTQYFRLERFTIILSICIVAVGIMISQEIKQIQIAGKWFGVTMFCLGYMSQSILIWLDGRAETYLKKKNDEEGVG